MTANSTFNYKYMNPNLEKKEVLFTIIGFREIFYNIQNI